MSTGVKPQREQVIAYIDGFNLYFGLMERGWRHYLWLDLEAMVKRLLRADQELVGVKYFTTRVNHPPESVKRQGIYLDAIKAHGGVEIIYGKFMYPKKECDDCGKVRPRRTEKQTDVNIALHMVRDAYGEFCDVGLLISGDSDLVPAVREVEKACPGRSVLVVWPPARKSDELCSAASRYFALGRKHVSESQLPSIVSGQDGYALCQPVEWWKDPNSPDTN
jgi:uncharacterized LabA/DUF88 family protein